MFKIVSQNIRDYLCKTLGSPVHILGYSGAISHELIGENGHVHSLIRANQYECIFLSIGQNDLNKIDFSEFTAEIAGKVLIENIIEKLKHFEGLELRLVVLPITLRDVAHTSKFAEAKSPHYIKRINEIIVNMYRNIGTQPKNVHFIDPSFIHRLQRQEKLTVEDGLHLEDHGKKIVLHESLQQFLQWKKQG